MRNDHPTEAFAASLYHALHYTLPDRKWTTKLGREFVERPRPQDVSIVAFTQQWGSTALAFDWGEVLAGAAMTWALTVVVEYDGVKAFYVDGRHAYTLVIATMTKDQLETLNSDLDSLNIAGQRDAEKYYGTQFE